MKKYLMGLAAFVCLGAIGIVAQDKLYAPHTGMMDTHSGDDVRTTDYQKDFILMDGQWCQEFAAGANGTQYGRTWPARDDGSCHTDDAQPWPVEIVVIDAIDLPDFEGTREDMERQICGMYGQEYPCLVTDETRVSGPEETPEP